MRRKVNQRQNTNIGGASRGEGIIKEIKKILSEKQEESKDREM